MRRRVRFKGWTYLRVREAALSLVGGLLLVREFWEHTHKPRELVVVVALTLLGITPIRVLDSWLRERYALPPQSDASESEAE